MRSGADPGPRPIGASLEHLLGNLDAPSVDVLDIVFRDWASIVGPDLAHHSRPVVMDGDLLVIQAADAAWASELRWLENQVVERVSTVTGSDRIRRVQVKVERQNG